MAHPVLRAGRGLRDPEASRVLWDPPEPAQELDPLVLPDRLALEAPQAPSDQWALTVFLAPQVPVGQQGNLDFWVALALIRPVPLDLRGLWALPERLVQWGHLVYRVVLEPPGGPVHERVCQEGRDPWVHQVSQDPRGKMGALVFLDLPDYPVLTGQQVPPGRRGQQVEAVHRESRGQGAAPATRDRWGRRLPGATRTWPFLRPPTPPFPLTTLASSTYLSR